MILFLAANPRDTGRLALDREARSIHLELKRSGYRDRFEFVTRWAAEPLDLLRELRELKPTIVHFSGHGARPAGTADQAQGRDVVAAAADEPGGVIFESANGRSQLVTPEAIARTLGAAGTQIRLVVLNACYSAPIAEALRGHVDCVVGMSGAIHDDAAHSFAIGFYGGLGEHESVAAAFEQAKAAIHLDGCPTPTGRSSRYVMALMQPSSSWPRSLHRPSCPWPAPTRGCGRFPPMTRAASTVARRRSQS